VCVCVFFLRILCSNCALVISSCGLLAVSRMCVAGAKKAGASSTLSRKKPIVRVPPTTPHTDALFHEHISLSLKKMAPREEKHTAGLLQEHSVLEKHAVTRLCVRGHYTHHTLRSFLFYILVLFVVGLHMINRRMVIH